jgi:hypothetical protein
MTFTNKEMVIALRYRLFLPQIGINAGGRCDCARHPRLDTNGHHLMTGCGKHGVRHATHDGLVSELHSILNYFGVRNRVEELGCFQLGVPDNNRRPDLSIMEGPISELKTVTDVQITCPINGAGGGAENMERERGVLTREHALEKGRSANRAAASKIGKYRNVCEQNRLGFIPLIFESTGYMHTSLVKLITDGAKHAADVKKIDQGVLKRYALKLLSVKLQKLLGQALQKRLFKLGSGSTVAVQSHFNYDVMR